MKIAVLLFGHLRTFEYASKFFVENIINKYDCDVFIHTWDELDSSTKSWNNKINYNIKVDSDIVQKVNSIYKPKKIIFGHQDNSKDETIESIDGKKIVSLNGMKYMFESLRKANELRLEYEKENNIKYDYILVTRPDVAIYEFLDIPSIVEEAQSLHLNIDNLRFFAGLYGNSKTNVHLLCNRMNDLLFFAKPTVIDRYIQANSNFIKEELDKTFYNVMTIYTKNEIKAGIYPLNICFELVRDFQNITFSRLEEINQKKSQKLFDIYNTVTHKVFCFLGFKFKFRKGNL